MTQSITADFDGRYIVPDEPVQLPVGPRVRVHFELADASPARCADLFGPSK
jgi:hypothetical protein